jgi:hypothetical protein
LPEAFSGSTPDLLITAFSSCFRIKPMPWKTNYTISDEISLSDRDIVWPGHNRCCFNVVVDLSLASGPEGLLPSDLATTDSVFAMGGGLAGLLDVLTSHKIVATFAVPAAMVKIYPEAIEAVLKQGHEVAAEGLFHEDVSQLSLEEERARMKAATSLLSEAIGSRPAGWYDLPRRKDKFAVGAISPYTTKLLVHRFQIPNHIRRLDRVCRTMCGRPDPG